MAERTRKTFHEGNWRTLFHDGTIGEKCAAPTAEERRQWTAEDAQPPFHVPKCLVEGNWGQSWHWRNPDGSAGRKCDPPTEAEVKEWDRRSITFPVVVEPPPPGTRIYKVVTQRDEFFGGQFDPVKLTQLMNELALDGWRVVAITAANVSSFFGTFWSGREAREELIAFLEKTV